MSVCWYLWAYLLNVLVCFAVLSCVYRETWKRVAGWGILQWWGFNVADWFKYHSLNSNSFSTFQIRFKAQHKPIHSHKALFFFDFFQFSFIKCFVGFSSCFSSIFVCVEESLKIIFKTHFSWSSRQIQEKKTIILLCFYSALKPTQSQRVRISKNIRNYLDQIKEKV